MRLNVRITKEKEHSVRIETIGEIRIIPHVGYVKKVEGKKNESPLNDEMNFYKVKQGVKG